MKNEQTAFVTGGAQGIGACITETLCRNGYRAIFCDIDEEKGKQREGLINEKGYDAVFLPGDVSRPDDIKRISDTLSGNVETINLIINNAGIADPEMPFPLHDTRRWRKVIETNLSGIFYTVNYLSELMPAGSCIISIASTRAIQSEKNTLAYSASKGGVVSLTHSLALTLSGRGIRANCISPGWVDTSHWKIPPKEPELTDLDHGQHPSGRVGIPEDIAELVLFLAGKGGEWINGENIVVDGGMTRRMIYFDENILKEIKGEI